MKILLVGGFFGAGKTTVLLQIAEAMRSAGYRLCVLENGSAAGSVSGLLAQREGLTVSAIKEGCVCCQATGNLIEALRNAESEYAPDWVLVELSGVGFADAVKESVLQYLPGSHRIVTLTVIDAEKWRKFLRAMEPVATRQIGSADIIVINKTDRNPETESIIADVKRIAPDQIIRSMQAVSDSGNALAALML